MDPVLRTITKCKGSLVDDVASGPSRVPGRTDEMDRTSFQCPMLGWANEEDHVSFLQVEEGTIPSFSSTDGAHAKKTQGIKET